MPGEPVYIPGLPEQTTAPDPNGHIIYEHPSGTDKTRRILWNNMLTFLAAGRVFVDTITAQTMNNKKLVAPIINDDTVGVSVTSSDINRLAGISDNVQQQLNDLGTWVSSTEDQVFDVNTNIGLITARTYDLGWSRVYQQLSGIGAGVTYVDITAANIINALNLSPRALIPFNVICQYAEDSGSGYFTVLSPSGIKVYTQTTGDVTHLLKVRFAVNELKTYQFNIHIVVK